VTRIWIGRGITALVVAFLLFDTVLHLMNIPLVQQASVELGFPVALAPLIGMIELLCVLLYAIPATSVLGAILLTGYLGGAVAAQLRVGNPLFGQILFPIYVGLTVWGGLWLRESRLYQMIPIRISKTAISVGESENPKS
jgi:hypothetical protein